MPSIDSLRLVWGYLLARLDIDPRREDGLTISEYAILTFLVVGGALVVAKIIIDAAKGNANSIPEPQQPTAGP